MKKQTFVLWALTGMLAVPASAQVDYKTRAIVAEPEKCSGCETFVGVECRKCRIWLSGRFA